jgi:hypothetical protein
MVYVRESKQGPSNKKQIRQVLDSNVQRVKLGMTLHSTVTNSNINIKLPSSYILP